jgi:hypothetical protein
VERQILMQGRISLINPFCVKNSWCKDWLRHSMIVLVIFFIICEDVTFTV